MNDDARSKAFEYLDRHNVMSLATVGPKGPWAAAVFYVRDGLSLYFLSAPTSRHCANLSVNPHAAATIHEDYGEWAEIRGVQLEGRVAEVGAAELTRVRALYAARFPVVGGGVDTPPAIAAALAKIRWYELTAEALHFIDNSAGFGHRTRVV